MIAAPQTSAQWTGSHAMRLSLEQFMGAAGSRTLDTFRLAWGQLTDEVCSASIRAHRCKKNCCPMRNTETVILARINFDFRGEAQRGWSEKSDRVSRVNRGAKTVSKLSRLTSLILEKAVDLVN
jgi:hypothetical protein